jgi:diacylglycerol kinase (ATP)
MPLLDPHLGVVLASPGASRLRDGVVRARVVAAMTDALRRRGVDRIEVVETADPAAIRATAAAAVRDGAATLAVAGGDGTIRDAAAAVADSDVALGIVPGGTGNLFAATLGMSRSIDQSIETLATGSARRCDLGWVRLEGADGHVHETPFTVAVGTGFDARVIEATSAEAKRRIGVAAYFLAASRLLENLRPQPTVITVDGVRSELTSVAVAIMNSGEVIPGGLRPRLPIPVDDGLLHAFVLPRGGIASNLHGLLELLLAAEPGESASGNGVRLVGRSVRVEVEPPAPVEVDGDPFAPAALDARVVPGALAVIRS